jgi:hypothetical protein
MTFAASAFRTTAGMPNGSRQQGATQNIAEVSEAAQFYIPKDRNIPGANKQNLRLYTTDELDYPTKGAFLIVTSP